MGRRFRKSRWRVANLVPGHWRYEKQGKGLAPKQVRNPGYSVRPQDRYFYRQSAETPSWYKPFKPKPIKRREKRGQGKPR